MNKLRVTVFLITLLLLVMNCASGPVVVEDGLTQEQIFQKAQEAKDNRDNPRALKYYETLIERYPGDIENQTVAEYEIAFIYWQTGEYEKATEFFNSILAKYEENPGLVAWPKILAEQMLQKIEEKTGVTEE